MTGDDLLEQIVRDNPDLAEDAILELFVEAARKDKRLGAIIALEAFRTLEANNFQGEGVTDELLQAYLVLMPKSAEAS